MLLSFVFYYAAERDKTGKKNSRRSGGKLRGMPAVLGKAFARITGESGR